MSDSGSLIEAFILHARKYRDTSMIVELFTRDHGRVPVVMRGVRGKKSKFAGHVQPFARLMVGWFGRGELKTVRTMDFPWQPPSFSGDALITGLYVNELLVRLSGKFEPMPLIFDDYGPLVHKISAGIEMPHALRRFELSLLRELGYGITFDTEANSGDPVDPSGFYQYVPDEGFQRVSAGSADERALPGANLLSIVEGEFELPEVDASAKRIIRASFATLLGERRLRSRELFQHIEVSS